MEEWLRVKQSVINLIRTKRNGLPAAILQAAGTGCEIDAVSHNGTTEQRSILQPRRSFPVQIQNEIKIINNPPYPR